jgi:hypothetical protein
MSMTSPETLARAGVIALVLGAGTVNARLNKAILT